MDTQAFPLPPILVYSSTYPHPPETIKFKTDEAIYNEKQCSFIQWLLKFLNSFTHAFPIGDHFLSSSMWRGTRHLSIKNNESRRNKCTIGEPTLPHRLGHLVADTYFLPSQQTKHWQPSLSLRGPISNLLLRAYVKCWRLSPCRALSITSSPFKYLRQR